MQKILMSSLLAVLILTGCEDSVIAPTVEASEEVEDTSDDVSSAEEREEDSEEEDDENDESYTDSENYEIHNQGVSCLSCHGLSSGIVEYDERFTSGGTVYTAIDSVSGYAKDYKIRLVLENTSTIVTYEIENGDGNSFTEYSEGLINSYTAQVVDASGVVVNSSLDNSHDVTRLDCNTCHTTSGTDGAPGRIVSYDYYASLTNVVENTTTTDTTTTTVVDTTVSTSTTNVSFASAVMPVLETNCFACHRVGGLNQDFIVSDTASTYSNISTSGYTNTTNADTSLLLTKGIGISHSGGAPLVNTSSTEYQTIRDWISQGALNN